MMSPLVATFLLTITCTASNVFQFFDCVVTSSKTTITFRVWSSVVAFTRSSAGSAGSAEIATTLRHGFQYDAGWLLAGLIQETGVTTYVNKLGTESECAKKSVVIICSHSRKLRRL